MTQSLIPEPSAVLSALGAPDAAVIAPVTGGADTLIWRVRWRECDAALRIFRPQQANVCRKEVAVMRAVSAAGIPAPQVLASGVWQDRPAMLMSWIEGRPLIYLVFERPDLVEALGMAFGRTQAAIHALSANAEMRLPANWLGWAGDGESAMQERLRALPARQNRLIHLDYHPLNVMATPEGISGVLDWANAHAGDPRADLARTYAILRIQPWASVAPTPASTRLRRALTHYWWRGYTEAAGLPQDMPLFFAWAGAMMQRDLAQYLETQRLAITPVHLAHIRRWTERWRRRVGLTANINQA